MISAFLKKTFDAKQINLIKPLQVYIRDAYGKDIMTKQMGTLKEIQQYRQSCIVDDKSVSPMSAMPQHEQYYAYVCILEKRFAWGKSGKGVFSKASKVEVWFKWVDSYRHTKIEQSMDIKLEKFAILFNLGALMSLHAVKLSETDDDGLKSACKLFKESAGVFQFLSNDFSSDAVAFVQNMDIQKDSCKFLSSLMLAQAQACFAEMAVSKKMKPKLVSSLAIGTAEFFQECVNLIDMTPALKSWIERGHYNFREHCLQQNKYYTAIAHYYESQRVAKLNKDGVYGEEIAWLKSANSLLQSMSNSKAKLIPTVNTHRKSLLRKLSPRLKEASKDNNDIYHDAIPNISNLKSIIGRQNVQITPFKPKTDLVKDPFKDMVPKDVRKKADILKTELISGIKLIQDKCNENTDNARAILASLGLPAAVDCVSGSQQGLPDPVWERIVECKKIGGVKELQQMYQRIESINQESWKILQDEIITILDTEQSIDDQIRAKLGNKWQRTGSNQLQKEYRQQCQVIANHLTTALETNSKIDKSIQDHSDKFSNLDKNRDDLAKDLPNVDDIKNNEEAEQLKLFLDELSECIDNRDKFKNQYSTDCNNIDIAQLFMTNKTATVDTVKNLAKKDLDLIDKQIDNGITKQTDILERISNQNELFLNSKNNDPKQTQREQIIHVLNETCVKFKDAHRHLKEGLKFYSDLMADYILPLKDEIDNYCVAREAERDLLLADLQQNIVKLGINLDATSAPASNPVPVPVAQQPSFEKPPVNPQPNAQPPVSATSPPATSQPQPQPQPHVQPYGKPKPGYNPYYSQQQQQPPPSGVGRGRGRGQPYPYGQQPPPQQYQYQQPPPSGYYQQPPPQQYPYGQPPPQQHYQYQQPPPSGYYQQPPPQQYYQQPPASGGYNPNAYNPNAPKPNNPSAPPQ